MIIDEYIKTFTLENTESSKEIHRLINMMPNYIKRNSIVKSYKKNDVIYRKDEETTFVTYVLEGSYIVVNEFESGKIYEPIILHKNDFIGVVEVVMNFSNIISTITANEDLQIFRFPAKDFKKWMDESFELTRMVLEAVSKNFFGNMRISGEGIILDTKYQFISHILQNASMVDDYYELNESREKTSKRTGINIRTLYRHIKELKDNNMITTKGRRIQFDENGHEELYNLYKNLRNK